MDKAVGVLALQGAYQKHIELLHRIGVRAQSIRQPHELEDCAGLIIPGGESTTMSLLIHEYGLYEPIKTFAESRPVMGVCAGMIMMATEVDDKRITPLGLIPFKALRNYYGTQVHSFTADLELSFDKSCTFYAHFIRAPGIQKISSKCEVLTKHNNEAVMIRNNNHLALSFHPELANDSRIHEHWLQYLRT